MWLLFEVGLIFSKYLKIEHDGVLNFLENTNFYGGIRTERHIFVKLYINLVDLNDLILQKAKSLISHNLERQVNKNILTKNYASIAINNI